MSEAARDEDWAGELGDRWLANVDSFESMLVPVGTASLARAAFQPGERVIDVGCGGGFTTRHIARAVGAGGAGGSVVGLDISAPLIAEARRRAERERVTNAQFLAQDAAIAKPPGAPFDRLYSRFGSMFFADPRAAFTNLHSMVRPGGRADFAVWAPPAENAWVGELMTVVRQHLDLPKPPPHAPGPFALDDADWFGGILTHAGFRNARFDRWQGLQPVGGQGRDPASATEFILTNTHFGDSVRQAPPPVAAKIREGIHDVFAQHQTSLGIEMRGSAWLVTATA